MPEITVVTASINRSTLRRAVESIQAQTLPPSVHCILFQQRLEAQVISLRKPSRVLLEIRWLPYQPGDMAEVYRLAEAMAQTDLIAMLDDDCWWEPDHLETLSALLLSTGSDFVWGSTVLHRQDGQAIGLRDDPLPAFGHIDMNEILFRRDCIDRWGDFSMDDPDMDRLRGRGIDGRRIERWIRGGAKHAHSSRFTVHYGWRPVPESYHGPLDEQGRSIPVGSAEISQAGSLSEVDTLSVEELNWIVRSLGNPLR